MHVHKGTRAHGDIILPVILYYSTDLQTNVTKKQCSNKSIVEEDCRPVNMA